MSINKDKPYACETCVYNEAQRRYYSKHLGELDIFQEMPLGCRICLGEQIGDGVKWLVDEVEANHE